MKNLLIKSSLLGEALLPEITEAMAECSTCCSLPSEMKRVAQPRMVKVLAFGALWKCNSVRMVCGYFFAITGMDSCLQSRSGCFSFFHTNA